MKFLNKQLTSSIKALCAATLIVCATPTWAWKPTTHTHVATMNDFTSWYTSTFRPAARVIAAVALYDASFPGSVPSVQKLADDPSEFARAAANLGDAKLQNLQNDIQETIERRSATASWGANYRRYRASGLFTTAQLNQFNQIYKPNLDIYFDFLRKANPSLATSVIATVNIQELVDDRRLMLGLNEEGVRVEKEDRLINDQDEIRIALGPMRKRVERASLENERGAFASLFFGKKYSEDSKIKHGASMNPVASNFEWQGRTVIQPGYLRGTRVLYLKSELYDTEEQDINETITYYVNQDISKNGAFIGMSVEESKRDLRALTEIATEEIGDPYIGYTLAQYAVRVGSLAYLALVRAQIASKVIDFTIFDKIYREAVDADTVISAATRSAITETRNRIVRSRNGLIAFSTVNYLLGAVVNDNARNAVLRNPNATLEEQQRAARRSNVDLITSTGGLLLQLGLLGVYNMPTTLKANSKELLKTWALDFIPPAFAISDITAATLTLVELYRDNKNRDPEKVKETDFYVKQAAVSRGFGAIWTLGSYVIRFYNVGFKPRDSFPWTTYTNLNPITMNTYTTMFAALNYAIAFGVLASSQW